MSTKPIEALTSEELRYDLAERLGYEYHEVMDEDSGGNMFADVYWTKDGAEIVIPDWTTNEGAVLRLCLDIARENECCLEITPDYERFDNEVTEIVSVRFEHLHTYATKWGIQDAKTPALALARLALEAKRGGAK